MCGIACIFNIKKQTPELRQKALSMAKKIRHRGPDWSGIYCGGSAILAHERLSIVDPQSGGQPLYSSDGKKILAVNGEIYNHRDIRAKYAGRYDFKTGSDCEVILALYQDKGIDFLEELSGIFAFALYDEERDEFLIARDPIGVIPLYIGHDADGTVYCASELKALEGFCEEYEPFLPGHYYWSREGKMKRWYKRDWMEYDAVKDRYTSLPEAEAYTAQVNDVRTALEAAVRRQLMSDVPYGVLLSGGLDSSVISAIAKIYADKRIEADGKAPAWWPQLHSFAVGLKGAPDLEKARIVAEHIGTVHHEINYTIQEGLDAIRDVIYYIETYDVTTVRASTPMYLLARVIKSMGIKMVLSGEGRSIRRLSLLPQSSYTGGFPRRNCPQAFQTLFVRLPARQQVACRMGRRRTCSVPRQRVPGCSHAPEPGSKDVPGSHHRKACRTRCFRISSAGKRGMAPEGTVLRWSWLLMDRHPEGNYSRSRQRRGNEARSRTIPDQPAAEQGRILLPLHFRRTFPERFCGPQRTERTECSMLYSRSAGMGRSFQELERSERPCRSRSTRGCLLDI